MNRITLSFITFALLNGSVLAQEWTTTGSNIHNTNTGRVGIGITTPLTGLDVVSTDGITSRRNTGNVGGNLHIGSGTGKWSILGNQYAGYDLSIIPATTGFPAMYFNQDGSKVGMGTTSPAAKLHLAGTGLLPLTITQLSGSGYQAGPANAHYDQFFDTWDAPGLKVNQRFMYHQFGGAEVRGGRNSLEILSILTAPTSTNNTDRNYNTTAFSVIANTGDGGTHPINDAKGAIFAMGGQAIARPSAQNLLGVHFAEMNIAMEAGSSALYKGMLVLAPYSEDKVRGSAHDCMICLSSQSDASVGLTDGILLGRMNGGRPLNSDGNVIRTEGMTIANGINLASATITQNAYSSPGFRVPGSGVTNCSAGVKTDASGTLSCIVSSRQFKTIDGDLQPAAALANVMALRPVRGSYTGMEDVPEHMLIAEEVAAIDDALVGYRDGNPYTVKIANIVVDLIAVVQQQQREIELLRRQK